MVKLLLFCLVPCVTLLGQTISVTAPTASQMTSGSLTLKCSVSATSLYAVNWFIDGEPIGFSTSVPYSLTTNTFDLWNGVHEVTATAVDSLSNVLATSAVVAFTVNNTWNYNSQGSQVSGTFTTSFTVAPGTSESSPWSGTVTLVATLGGTYNTAAVNPNGGNTRWVVQVDGKLVEQDNLGNVTTDTISLNTTKFPNGPHQVVFTGGVDSIDFYGVWERTITFSNGATAMELRSAANSTTVGRDVFLCVTAAANCPSTVTLAGTIVNTDGTTSAATPTFSAAAPGNANNPTPACAVGSSTGVVTVSATGMCKITMSASGLSETIWVHIFSSANVFPHFETNGTIATGPTDANSLYLIGLFNSDLVVGGNSNQAPAYSAMPNACSACDYAAAGFNSYETGACLDASNYSSQSTYQSAQASAISGIVSFATQYGLYVHGINDGVLRGDQPLYDTTRGPGSTWSPTATTYCWQQWASQGRMIGVSQADEVNSIFGFEPRNGLPQMGTASGPSSIVASGNTATVNWTNWNVTGSGSGNFIITGATTSGFNSAQGSVYSAPNKINANSFSFPVSGVSAGTYNSSTDPNLVIQPYVNAWHGSDYNQYNAFMNYMTWSNLATGRPKFTWPNAGLTSPAAFYNWEGDPNMADYADCYDPSGGHTDYLSAKRASWGMIDPVNYDLGETIRDMCSSNVNLNAEPIILETGGLTNDYGIEGYSATIASISNDLVTFTAPHGITIVYPGTTRLQISGSSNSAYNTKFYVRSIISPTVLQVYGQFSSSTSGTGGTVTFADGTIYPSNNGTLATNANSNGNLSIGSNPTCTFFRHVGQNATVTGSGNTPMNGVAFFVPLANPSYGTDSAHTNYCQNQTYGFPTVNIYAIPSGSSSGGTASIIPDNYMHKGMSWQYGTAGNLYNYAAQWLAVIDGAAGVRLYHMGQDYQSYDPLSGTFSAQATASNQSFGDPRSDSAQQGIFPLLDPQRAPWFGVANANVLINRLLPYLYGARLASPDYGNMFETAARTGTVGNILMIQSFADGIQSRTINLAPYLISGQQIIKYSSAWNGTDVTTLAAGTTTDTVSFNPAATVVYLFPANFAGELVQPSMSVRLADVPNAAAWAVRYAYFPYLVDQRLTAFDCGSAAACMLPLDRKIGPIYYRIIFRNSNNAVIAVSDIQSM